MKKTADIHEKIAVQAYYAWLNGSTAPAEADWLAAEQIEQTYAERRAMTARKAAETRKAKTSLKAPIAASTVANRRPTIHPAAAH